MKNWTSLAGVAGIVFALSLDAGRAQETRTPAAEKGTRMTEHARGEFDVKVTPVALGGPAEDATLGRMTIEKKFHGDISGTSTGQMLTAMDGKGSGAYVAIERVAGSLHGRSGSFTFQHWGTMTPNGQHLQIEVVPGSGSGGLSGLAGTFAITIDGSGKHTYDFAYSLPAAG